MRWAESHEKKGSNFQDSVLGAALASQPADD